MSWISSANPKHAELGEGGNIDSISSMWSDSMSGISMDGNAAGDLNCTGERFLVWLGDPLCPIPGVSWKRPRVCIRYAFDHAYRVTLTEVFKRKLTGIELRRHVHRYGNDIVTCQGYAVILIFYILSMSSGSMCDRVGKRNGTWC